MAQFQGDGAGRVQVEVLEPKRTPAQHRLLGQASEECKIAQTDLRSGKRGLVVPQPVRVEKAFDMGIVSRGGTLAVAAVSDKGRPSKVKKVGCEKPVVHKALCKVPNCEMVVDGAGEGALELEEELETRVRYSERCTQWCKR